MYSIEQNSSRRLLPALTAAFVLVLMGLAFAKSAEAEVVYDNIEPNSLIENPVSLGYEATGTSEFGSQISLAGAGADAEVELLMSVWSCQTGEWSSGCVTTPGATFAAPLTLNVYEVGQAEELGELLETKTGTFNLAYRPSSEPGCIQSGELASTRFRNANGVCNHGKPEPVKFQLGADLPHRVIVTVAFNTHDYGATPNPGPVGPMDDLNVGLEGPAYLGSNPVEQQNGVYWATKTNGKKDATLDYYSEEPEEWPVGESQIAVRVINPTVLPVAPTNGINGSAGTSGAPGTNGSNGSSGSNEGSVALKRKMSLKFLSGKATVSGGKAAVKVRCLGSAATRCVGTLKLTVAGQTATLAYSVAAGKKATLKVPLAGIDLTSAGANPTAAAVARTVQSTGGAATAKRTLHLS